MKTFSVTDRSTGEPVEVIARNEWSAVAKSHAKLTGEKATSKNVTWHGTHAECNGRKYNKPVCIWSQS